MFEHHTHTTHYYCILHSTHNTLPLHTTYYILLTTHYPYTLHTTFYSQHTTPTHYILHSTHNTLPLHTTYYILLTTHYSQHTTSESRLQLTYIHPEVFTAFHICTVVFLDRYLLPYMNSWGMINHCHVCTSRSWTDSFHICVLQVLNSSLCSKLTAHSHVHSQIIIIVE